MLFSERKAKDLKLHTLCDKITFKMIVFKVLKNEFYRSPIYCRSYAFICSAWICNDKNETFAKLRHIRICKASYVYLSTCSYNIFVYKSGFFSKNAERNDNCFCLYLCFSDCCFAFVFLFVQKKEKRCKIPCV